MGTSWLAAPLVVGFFHIPYKHRSCFSFSQCVWFSYTQTPHIHTHRTTLMTFCDSWFCFWAPMMPPLCPARQTFSLISPATMQRTRPLSVSCMEWRCVCVCVCVCVYLSKMWSSMCMCTECKYDVSSSSPHPRPCCMPSTMLVVVRTS